MIWGILPFAGQIGLSTGDHRVTSQHFKGAGFTCPVYPQQTKTLQEKKHRHHISKDDTCSKFLFSKQIILLVLYLPAGDANTQPVHCWLLLALVNLGKLSEFQDVRLPASAQDPLPLSGDILVFFSDRFEVAGR